MMLQKVSPRATRVSSWLPALVDWHACFDVSPNAELLPVSWIMQGEKNKFRHTHMQIHLCIS